MEAVRSDQNGGSSSDAWRGVAPGGGVGPPPQGLDDVSHGEGAAPDHGSGRASPQGRGGGSPRGSSGTRPPRGSGGSPQIRRTRSSNGATAAVGNCEDLSRSAA